MSELGDEARALIAEARHGGDGDPTAADRARVRAKLAAAVALSGAAGAATHAALPKTAAAQLAATGLGTKLVVASLVVATAGAAVVSVRAGLTAHERMPARSSAVQASAPGTQPSQPRELTTQSAEAKDAQPSAPPSSAPKAITARAPERRAAATAKATPPSLQAELALIEAAQAALRRGRPAAALARAAEHAARFPNGALIQERLGIDAVASCALGQRARGLEALSKLTRRAPNAPLLARARAACRAPGAE